MLERGSVFQRKHYLEATLSLVCSFRIACRSERRRVDPPRDSECLSHVATLGGGTLAMALDVLRCEIC